MENQNPGHQFVGGVLSKNRNKSKGQESPDPSKGDRVVKDLYYFLDEVARELLRRNETDIYYESFNDLENAAYYQGHNGNELILVKVTLVATERWYKQQLEEKDKTIAIWKNYTHDWQHAEMGVSLKLNDATHEIEFLTAIIEEQKKEISHLNGQIKLYSGVYSTIANLERTIEKLTQENKSLKQK